VSRISYLEQYGSSLAIAAIKAANPYIGINEYYALGEYDQIPFAKDKKFFQYYRHLRNCLYGFGVVVRAYTDILERDLFKIDKCQNVINIGCDHYSNHHLGTNDFSSSTVIMGNFEIKNNNGISITTDANRVRLKANSNDMSFEIDNYPNENIVLARGLRTSVTNNEVVFHKPGDTITDNNSPNYVKLPFGMNLSNLESSVFN
jgi:hypothetical protein